MNSFDDRMITPLVERLGTIGLDEKDIDLTNIYGYITLFDALKMFATAGRRVLNETKKFSSLYDGTVMWNAMRRMTIAGMVSNAGVGSGTVMLDDLAERVPYYAAFFVDKAREQVKTFANMVPKLIAKCDGLKTGTGCFEINVTEVASAFWPSVDGNLPADELACGYRGERCDYTLIIITCTTLLSFILILTGAWLLRRYCNDGREHVLFRYHLVVLHSYPEPEAALENLLNSESKALDRMPWRVFRDDMQIVDEEQMKSMLSLGSQRTKLSNTKTMALKHHAIIGVNTHATYHLFEQRRPIKFGREDLVLLTRVKQAVHDNLNPFLGMAFNERNEMLLLWKFCSRGTLQDVIYNEQFVLDEKFHGAFVKDITMGLEYLHLSNIGFHGALTTWSTLIDRNWQVKLTDYGVCDAVTRWIKHGCINEESMKDGEEKSEQPETASSQKIGALYIAPEIRMANDQNQKRRVDQNWIKQQGDGKRKRAAAKSILVIYKIPEGIVHSESRPKLGVGFPTGWLEDATTWVSRWACSLTRLLGPHVNDAAIGGYEGPSRRDLEGRQKSVERRRSADIYAFGMVMYEILFRNFPFNEKADIHDLATKAAQGEKVSRPTIQKDKQLHPDLQALLQDCWHDSPDARPSIRRVRLSTEAILKTLETTPVLSRTSFPYVETESHLTSSQARHPTHGFNFHDAKVALNFFGSMSALNLSEQLVLRAPGISSILVAPAFSNRNTSSRTTSTTTLELHLTR
ncbi:unnamed protein product [Nippostrongylus brasiliensis]|uniref:guanylate cyclase n=1 Tax=Nippostrongylus brasiliensis TaxID=27835 RepID=A0A0N4XEV5_NIPBR|nr:unnamed protein product [Nippostrongylus brasiliensis]